MTSLDIISFKKNVTDYIKSCHEAGMPFEAMRLSLKEILEETSRQAISEAMAQAKEQEEKEKEDGRQDMAVTAES